MTEEELVKMMYQKHQKWTLGMKEAPSEWGRSYSFITKLFGGKNAIPDTIILEKKIIPPWIEYRGRRMWKITDIANWIVSTGKKGKNDE